VAFNISFDQTEVGHVSGETIHVVDNYGLEEILSGIVAESIEFRSSQNAAAPTLILIHIQNDPPFLAGEFLEFRNLRINGLTFPLFFGGNAGV
jgi:hypothetical protein